MKKVLFALIGCFVAICAHAAQVVNVDYIHKLIQQEWDVTVPIRTDNVMAAANMKYLLTAIDVANQILNGEKTTDYGNGEFATLQVADTIATNQAVETLIKQNQIEYKFSVTIDIGKANEDCLMYGGVEQMTSEYGIYLSAAGTFYIDWGDGTTETIKKTDTEPTDHMHDYGTKSGVFTIRIGGKATDYNDNVYTASISFTNGHSMCAMISNGISSIDGSLGAIFSTLPNGSQPRFTSLFDTCHNLTGTIPENLFDGIYGNLVDNMFSRTFSYCSGLTGPSARINGQYLYEIWPDATEDQVAYMYEYASRLDDYVCIATVWGGLGEYCESSPDIPAAPENATYDFYLTTTSDINVFSLSIGAAGEFYIDWGDGKTQLITKSDTGEELFTHQYNTAGAYTIGIGGQATAYNADKYVAAISFSSSASKIASIDGSLGAIFGTLANDIYKKPRFYRTFWDAYNMTGSIPANLFAGISGAPTSNMFDSTFLNCSGLTSIPAGLFAGISGAPAWDMFKSTFSGCTGLTSIPENLFGNISGRAMSGMFHNTFSRCTGLTSIPENLFGNISGTAQDEMFRSTFKNCTSLTGPSARINGQYLYEIWPDATLIQVGEMYTGATGLEDYRCIPTVWGGLGETCAPAPEFTLTTTSSTRSFDFSISAAGEFVVDWGDGTVETITKPDTTATRYSHNYSTAGAYTIGLSGQATAYNTNKYTAAISFYYNASRIASIDGSLGAIFGTLSSDTNNQPRFYMTFYGGSNMTGSIPSDLFAGISGAPASYMFYSTFDGCSSLTSIPAGLFGNLSGAPAIYMFYSTFEECSGLTSIPDGLFAGISGAPAESMFDSTFRDCSGLTSIPDGLFAGISGAPASGMFYGTFYGCSGLTSIPENLFGNISGTAQFHMFKETFSNCTSLTGPSARINGQYLYEIWPVSDNFCGTYANATKLDDYSSMPYTLKNGFCGSGGGAD